MNNEFKLTRKQIGSLLNPHIKKPQDLVGYIHDSNKDLLINNIDYIKTKKEYLYTSDCVELFRLLAEEMGYKSRKINKEILEDII